MEMKVCWIRFFVRKLLTFWSFYELAARKLASRMLYKLSESALLKSEVCCYNFISDLSVDLLRPGKGGVVSSHQEEVCKRLGYRKD